MGITSNPDDPEIVRGPPDEIATGQHSKYLVLSEEERAKGFVRPVRRSYVHVGIAGPRYPTCDLSHSERDRYRRYGYVKFEAYPPDADSGATGRFWTRAELDSIGKGCGAVTTMGYALAETYARDPFFYGATYCVGCSMHRPVGTAGEFVWDGTDERVGT